MKDRLLVPVLLFLVTLSLPVQAQTNIDPDTPKYEFRGAWIATVINLDWPSSRTASTSSQQAELVAMLDDLKAAGINAVFFQVRSESDALYDSPYEPWSYWLTGAQGQAPDPFYDPLAFAVEEAHQRGMELHAWFNPYRAIRGSGYANAASHVTVTHPEWTLAFGPLVTLNPGMQAVRDYISTVIADVVRRYDIDGVHFDDYFYPYPPNQVTDQDEATFAAESRGITDLGDWRRDNINIFIAQVADSVSALKPDVTFGISPFGIWKNGVPAGIVGLDAYNVIFADATAWLDAETIDYVVPQLYWPFGGQQAYGKLAPWWSEQTNGRHLYTGHGLYRADAATFSGTLFDADEIPHQVRFNRIYDDIQGSVFFRARNITTYSSKGIADSLSMNLYRYPALTPPMGWKDLAAPQPPTDLAFTWTEMDDVVLNWSPPATSDPEAERYAVYRIRSAEIPDFADAVTDARNLFAVTGETTLTDRPEIADDPYYYVVTSVSSNSIESAESNYVVLDGRVVNNETETPAFFTLHQNYPNPFRSSTEIRVTLDRPATLSLRIYNMLGQEVIALAGGVWSNPGTYTYRWDGKDAAGNTVGSGAYYYVLDADGRRETKGMVRMR